MVEKETVRTLDIRYFGKTKKKKKSSLFSEKEGMPFLRIIFPSYKKKNLGVYVHLRWQIFFTWDRSFSTLHVSSASPSLLLKINISSSPPLLSFVSLFFDFALSLPSLRHLRSSTSAFLFASSYLSSSYSSFLRLLLLLFHPQPAVVSISEREKVFCPFTRSNTSVRSWLVLSLPTSLSLCLSVCL